MDEDRLATVTDLPNYTLWGNDSTVTRQAAALNWIVAHFVDTTEQGEEGEEKPPPTSQEGQGSTRSKVWICTSIHNKAD